jgi:hypothetical protein
MTSIVVRECRVLGGLFGRHAVQHAGTVLVPCVDWIQSKSGGWVVLFKRARVASCRHLRVRSTCMECGLIRCFEQAFCLLPNTPGQEQGWVGFCHAPVATVKPWSALLDGFSRLGG